MKKLQFKNSDVKIHYGVPSKVKLFAMSILIAGATMSCTTDDCRTTSTDLGSSADLGAQQDPNTYCDAD